MLIYGAKFEHNRKDIGALLQSIIGNFKSIIGTSLLIMKSSTCALDSVMCIY